PFLCAAFTGTYTKKYVSPHYSFSVKKQTPFLHGLSLRLLMYHQRIAPMVNEDREDRLIKYFAEIPAVPQSIADKTISIRPVLTFINLSHDLLIILIKVNCIFLS
ncbi:MAG: hypothetical protein Q8912_12405, partial [Bacillota bacterium]|nr:hypothetical protein [Bacillota bacterium]